jgi:hypothetical protein
MHAMHNHDALATSPDPVGAADVGGLSLDEWMKEDGLDDGRVGEMVGKDRTTVYRVRIGKTKPSFDFIDAMVTASGGKVQPNSFFKRALARAAASRGGDAHGPFNSTSSPQGRRLVARAAPSALGDFDVSSAGPVTEERVQQMIGQSLAVALPVMVKFLAMQMGQAR